MARLGAVWHAKIISVYCHSPGFMSSSGRACGSVWGSRGAGSARWAGASRRQEFAVGQPAGSRCQSVVSTPSPTAPHSCCVRVSARCEWGLKRKDGAPALRPDDEFGHFGRLAISASGVRINLATACVASAAPAILRLLPPRPLPVSSADISAPISVWVRVSMDLVFPRSPADLL